MSDSHGEGGTQGQGASHGGSTSRSLRLLLLAIIMLGFAALAFLPSLFARHGTGVSSTGTNLTEIFIPVWLTLTVATVIISFWFARTLMTAERSRDSETPHPATPAPSH